MSPADLLLHPVRLRVVQALLGEESLTTADLRRRLDDVPTASLYRHVATLHDAGVLEVVDERRVRGAVERSYALRTEVAQVAGSDAAAMDLDAHRRAFTTFVAGLLADFGRYLARGDVDLDRDQVGYRQLALHLSDQELRDLLEDLRGVLEPRLAHGPAPGRRRRVVTAVLLPAPESTGEAPGA